MVGVVGTFLFLGGIAWLGALIYSIRDYPEAVKYEFRAPWTPRLMVFFGLTLLLIFGAQIGFSYLCQRRKPRML
jgi:predicted MFS family arabinose efflux permease